MEGLAVHIKGAKEMASGEEIMCIGIWKKSLKTTRASEPRAPTLAVASESGV